jgi:hypothetical protein
MAELLKVTDFCGSGLKVRQNISLPELPAELLLHIANFLPISFAEVSTLSPYLIHKKIGYGYLDWIKILLSIGKSHNPTSPSCSNLLAEAHYRLAFIYQNQTKNRGERCHHTTKIGKPVFDSLREICQIPSFIVVVRGCITRTNRNRKRLMGLLSRALGLMRTLCFSMMASITWLCNML